MSSSSSARISISSDEVNLLVYRYLIEAGFKHSAFVFHGESLLHRSSNLVQADMPPGSLVSLLQKSLLFLYLETHIGNDGKQISCDEPFSLFKPHEHEYGPMDSIPKFEESQVTKEKVKRSESVDGDAEETGQIKKLKQSSKLRDDNNIEEPSEKETPAPEEEAVDTFVSNEHNMDMDPLAKKEESFLEFGKAVDGSSNSEQQPIEPQ